VSAHRPVSPIEDLETARREIEKLRARNERLIDFMSTACDILWESDAEHRFIHGAIPMPGGRTLAELREVDPAICRYFSARSLYEVPGSPEDGYRSTILRHEDLRARRPFRGFEYPITGPDGETIWMESSGNPVYDSNGVFQGYRGTTRNITRRKLDETQIAFMARHDALTGLPNRVCFAERLKQALAENSGRGVAVLSMDLDRFKMVNDTLGHPVGDLLLKKIAQQISGCLRGVDLVARLGGDEFALVIPGISRPQVALRLAQRILEKVNQSFNLDGHQVTACATIGIAIAPADGNSPETILKNADIALYRAKTSEPGTARFFEPEMGARLRARQAIEMALRGALERSEFHLLYQPVCDTRSGRVSAFEALLRWRPREREGLPGGDIQPADFLPVAEETGLIIPIGEWVLREACADAMSWPEEIRLAVNLSPGQFKDNQPMAAVERALAASGLSASRLELEVTEAALSRGADHAIRVLQDLRKLGARIVMDDFGAGNSCLNHLRSFPFERIKINRAFVRDIATSPSAAAIVRALTGLGKGLNLCVTAEGVETAQQLAALQACECVEMQGFLFSGPVRLAETRSLVSGEFRGSRPAAHPENDLLSRFPWKNPQIASPAAGGCLPVQVTGDGDILHGEAI